MTSGRLFNSFIPPPKKNLYPPPSPKKTPLLWSGPKINFRTAKQSKLFQKHTKWVRKKTTDYIQIDNDDDDERASPEFVMTYRAYSSLSRGSSTSSTSHIWSMASFTTYVHIHVTDHTDAYRPNRAHNSIVCFIEWMANCHGFHFMPSCFETGYVYILYTC